LSDLSVQFLAEIENGKKNMTTISLYKLSKALHVSTDYIVFGEGNPKQNDFEIILSTLSKRNREYAKELLSVFINAVKGK
jgi:transcriptional regulator with XRE-family HTH domain